MSHPYKQWTCHECGETGLEKGAHAARFAFEQHWAECHQEVPF